MYRGTITKTDVKSTYGPVNIYFKTDLNLSYKYLQFTRLSTVNLICLNVSAVGTTVIDMLCCLETAKIFFSFHRFNHAFKHSCSHAHSGSFNPIYRYTLSRAAYNKESSFGEVLVLLMYTLVGSSVITEPTLQHPLEASS